MQVLLFSKRYFAGTCPLLALYDMAPAIGGPPATAMMVKVLLSA